MTKQKIIKLMEDYQVALKDMGYKPIELTNYDSKFSDIDKEIAVNQAYWMCQKIIMLVNNDEIEKANRWLGFVQGVFWSANIYTINEMRDQNRENKL